MLRRYRDKRDVDIDGFSGIEKQSPLGAVFHNLPDSGGPPNRLPGGEEAHRCIHTRHTDIGPAAGGRPRRNDSLARPTSNFKLKRFIAGCKILGAMIEKHLSG